MKEIELPIIFESGTLFQRMGSSAPFIAIDRGLALFNAFDTSGLCSMVRIKSLFSAPERVQL